VQEGENICFEVLEAVSASIRRQDKTTVFRAKFSSITDKDIVAAMNSLGQPDENQSKSVDARQELDLRIGCAFTRFQTRFFQVPILLTWIQCCGSGSGMGKKSGSGSGISSPDHNSEISKNIFWVKIMKFFVDLGSWIRDGKNSYPGSGMEKKSDPVSGMNIANPNTAWMLVG
jgi:hypothetical protein